MDGQDKQNFSHRKFPRKVVNHSGRFIRGKGDKKEECGVGQRRCRFNRYSQTQTQTQTQTQPCIGADPSNPRSKAGAGDSLEKVQKYLLMANRAQIPTSNSALIAMIADEDTVVGFLLAGVGNVDLRRKTNYLIVDSKTTIKQIEDAFKEFTTREDIAVVLISQYVANMIRFLVDSYNKPVPAILEIPSKDHPYDPAHDSILSRVKYLFSAESVASGRR
ncbi:hypothetical protein V6N13_140357 [Hibiscus sabdariffa]